jgi:hypothetical protein
MESMMSQLLNQRTSTKYPLTVSCNAAFAMPLPANRKFQDVHDIKLADATWCQENQVTELPAFT